MIEISAKQIERIEMILQGVPGGVKKVIQSVIPRATQTIRSVSLKEITRVYDIKLKDAFRGRASKSKTINLSKQKYSDGSIVGRVRYSGYKLPLYRFGVSHKEPTPMPHRVPAPVGHSFTDGWRLAHPGKPVRARKLKSETLGLLPGAFIARMPNGHKGIFKRVKRTSSELREIMAASVAEMAEHTDVLEKAETAAMDTISKRIEHEITRILNGHGMR